MKRGKVLCCMFLLLFWGLAMHKTWQNTERGYVCTCNYQYDYVIYT